MNENAKLTIEFAGKVEPTFEESLKRVKSSINQTKKELSTMTSGYYQVQGALEKSTGATYGYATAQKRAAMESYNMRIQTTGLRRYLGELRNRLLVVAFTYALVIRPMEQYIDAANKMQAATLGLGAVATKVGESGLKVMAAATELTASGLLNITDASAGLKNLLSTGMGLENAIKVMKALGDAAAFNRQGTLAYGEAIVGATMGIKNQNSIMVDNCFVGQTKVLTEIGEQKIEDIVKYKKDIKVYAYDTKKKKVVLKKIINWWDNGKKPVYKLKTEDGHEFISTETHNFYRPNEKKIRLNELKVGEEIAIWGNEDTENIEDIRLQGSKIISIEFYGYENTYNITVEDTHNYFVVSPNSPYPVLSSNSGITKNLSIMWKEYAASIGKTVGQLTEAEKTQASVNGVIKEGAIFIGNAALMAETFQGKQAKLNKTMFELKAIIGTVLQPIFGAFIDIIADLAEKTKLWYEANKNLINLHLDKFVEKLSAGLKTISESMVSTVSSIASLMGGLSKLIEVLTKYLILKKIIIPVMTKLITLFAGLAGGTKALIAALGGATAAAGLMLTAILGVSYVIAMKILGKEKDYTDMLHKRTAAMKESTKFLLESNRKAIESYKDLQAQLIATAGSFDTVRNSVYSYEKRINELSMTSLEATRDMAEANAMIMLAGLDKKSREVLGFGDTEVSKNMALIRAKQELNNQIQTEINLKLRLVKTNQLDDEVAVKSLDKIVQRRQRLEEYIEELDTYVNTNAEINKQAMAYLYNTEKIADAETQLMELRKKYGGKAEITIGAGLATGQLDSEFKKGKRTISEAIEYLKKVMKDEAVKMPGFQIRIQFDPADMDKIDSILNKMKSKYEQTAGSIRLSDKETYEAKIKSLDFELAEVKGYYNEVMNAVNLDVEKEAEAKKYMTEFTKDQDKLRLQYYNEYLSKISEARQRDAEEEYRLSKRLNDYHRATLKSREELTKTMWDRITGVSQGELNTELQTIQDKYEEMTNLVNDHYQKKIDAARNAGLDIIELESEKYARLLQVEQDYYDQSSNAQQEFLMKRTENLLKSFESIIGSYQNLGDIIYDSTLGVRQMEKEKFAELEEMYAQGNITAEQFAKARNDLDKATNQESGKIWKSFGANIIRTLTSTLGQIMIQQGMAMIFGAKARAQDSRNAAQHFASMAGIWGILAMAQVPGAANFAAFYTAAAAGATALATSEGVASAIQGGAMIAGGAALMAAGGFAASAMEGGKGGFSEYSAPTGGATGEGGRSLGSVISAREMDVYIAPVTNIIVEDGVLVIGNDATLEGLEGTLNQLAVSAIQNALESGEVRI